MLLILCASVNLFAQNSSKGDVNEVLDNAILDLEFSVGTSYKHLQQFNYSIELGYLLFNRVYPYARYESSLLLYKHEGKHYGNTYNLGGGLGVILYREENSEDLHDGVEFTANVTTSIGGHDYRNTSYYAGFRIGYKERFIGLGFRRMQAHDSAHFPSYNAFVISIGF